MRNATASLSGAVKYAASSAEEGSITIPVNNTRQRLINMIHQRGPVSTCFACNAEISVE